VGVPETETIVVDGGSEDETGKLAAALGAQVFSSPRGRSKQMNLAASKASGEILLFLHADTHLPENFQEHVVSALRCSKVAGGAFQLVIRGSSISLRLIELGVNIRSRLLKIPYGDQAIFLRTETFKRLNGFKEMQIMEDLDLVRRLGKVGRIAIVNASVVTSARRWNQVGILKTTLINQIAVASYFAGVSPARIACFYRRNRPLP
jgi:rSAM/selenodomain-associated transferase 2